jgi:uncharacterized repeat protein (TIGR03803 family)
MFKGSFRLAMILALTAVSSTFVHAQTFKVVYAFKGGNDAAYPQADLIRDQKGTLYGTTSGGGKFSQGTVFQLYPNGKEKVLYAFPGFVYGAYPFGKLVRNEAGDLYGTTSSGGGQFGEQYGTVFQLKSTGKLRNLIVFTGLNGISPTAGVIEDSAGNLYGTTIEGGPSAEGTVFKFSKFGHQKTLYGFGPQPDGGLPFSPLLGDEAGSLYGTTLSGGVSGFGTVFEVGKSGKETILYQFLGGMEGEHPNAGLIRDRQGNLYGTTVGTTGIYPPFYYGTIFKLDPAGTETLLYSFTGGADGGFPYGGLVQDDKGNLYGTTYAGGSFNHGTVFRLDVKGNLTTLHHFTGGKDGSSPYAGLLIHSGRLYGTAANGGAFNFGTVFRITLR